MFPEAKLYNPQDTTKRFQASFMKSPLRVTKPRFFRIIRKRFPVNSHDIRLPRLAVYFAMRQAG